jgi:hypothetical protein
MRREPSRIREHGTRVTAPLDGDERIAAIRRIVEDCQYAKIDGVMIDLYSASAILVIYDKLSPENQTKYRAMPAPKMAAVAFTLVR